MTNNLTNPECVKDKQYSQELFVLCYTFIANEVYSEFDNHKLTLREI